MKTIHQDNLRAWFGIDAFSTIPNWGDVTKMADGSWVITPKSRERLREYVGRLAWEGINGKHMLPYAGWLNPNGMQKPEDCFTPYIYENGAWDLDKRNLYYFPIVKEVIGIFKEFNVEMPYCLFDNCQYWVNRPLGDAGIPYWACWMFNKQGNQNYMQDIPRSVAWAQEVMDNIGGYDNVLIEVVNEGQEWGGLENTKNWFRAIAQAVKDKGLEPERFSVGVNLTRKNYLGNFTFQPTVEFQEWTKNICEGVFGDSESHGIILPVHGVLGDMGGWYEGPKFHSAPELVFGQMFHEPIWAWGPVYTRRKWIVSNDGNNDKDSPEAREAFNKMCAWSMANIQQVTEVGYRMIYEMECDSLDLEVKLAGARAMAEGLGIQNLVNYHRKEYTPEVPPECKIGETKTMVCKGGSTIITDTCEGGKWKPTGAVCPPVKCSCFYYLNIHDTAFGIVNFLKCLFGKIEKYCKKI
jgi:hypothetical protein